MLDWDDLRHVLAVARCGSLAAAADALHVDATTVGRRVAAAEAYLGMPIFVRQRGAWRTTTVGAEVVAAAEAAEKAVHQAAAVAREREATPRGRVHVTTVEAVATWLIAPLLPRLHARWPDVEVLLSSTPTVLDLTRGEADLAVRVGTPSEPDLVARKLGAFVEVPYTSRRWLEAQGIADAEAVTRLEGAPLVVMPATGHRGDLERAGGGRVALRTGSTTAMIEAVAAGLGVGILPNRLADRDKRLVALPNLGLRRERNLWLLFREEVAKAPAVRVVADALVEGLARG